MLVRRPELTWQEAKVMEVDHKRVGPVIQLRVRMIPFGDTPVNVTS